MSAGGIRMGGVFVEISADARKFFASLGRVNKSLSDMGRAMAGAGATLAGVGAAITTPIMGAAAAFSVLGDNVQKMAIRTGLSTEAVSGLAFAAEQSGTDVASLEKGIRTMQKTLDAASTKGGAAADAFKRLGVDVQALTQMSPEQQFMALAEALSAVEDPGERAALAMKVFGKAGTSLLPMLMEGSSGIAALVAQARQLGIVMDQQTADDAALLNDTLNEMRTAMKAVAMSIGAAVAPMLAKAARILGVLIGEVSRFVTENKGMVRYALLAGGVITGLGVALTTAGFAAMGLSAAFSALGAVVGVIVSPIGLVVAGLASLVAFGPQIARALGQAFGGVGQSVGSVLSMVGEPLAAAIQNAGVVLADLGNIASTTFDGIFDAITAGNLMLAFDILMAGLYAGWARGSEAILNAIDPWITSLQNLFTMLGTYIAATWDAMWVNVIGALDISGAVLRGTFDNIINGVMAAFDAMVAAVRKSWNYVQSFIVSGYDLAAENNKVDSDMAARARQRELERPGIASRVADARERDRTRREESQERMGAMFDNANDTMRQREEQNQRNRDERRQNTLNAEQRVTDLSAQAAQEAADKEQADAERRRTEVRRGAGSPDVSGAAEVVGTFSSFALGQVGFGSEQLKLLKRIADNTEQEDEAEVAA